MEQPSPAPAAAMMLQRSRLWHPNLIVFMSSASIMVLELVAGRIIAPYVGVSLYTWTSVIGVVLAGISLGNYVGGRIADKRASPHLLGAIFCLGGLLSLGVLAAEAANRTLSLDNVTNGTLALIGSILLLTMVLFFLPCSVLGMISPIVAKLAVQDLDHAGSTVGKIYAAGSIGSIFGTFITGFFLIAWFGTHRIVLGVSVVLFSLGLVFLLHKRKAALIASLLAVTIASTWALWGDRLAGPCLRETNYYCIRVTEEEHDGHPVHVLLLDRLVHSYSSLDDPTRLVYGYERAYAQVAAYQSELARPLHALFIGGGGYTFPRYLQAVYPDSELDVIEIDPGVTETAYERLGLSRSGSITSYNQDARLYLEREPDRSYNLIFGDAFNDFSVPYHLTTREFNERVRAWLSPDGLYVVNMIDGRRALFLRAYVHTLQQSFPHVYLAPSISSWRDVSRSTFVLIAANTPLDLSALQDLNTDQLFSGYSGAVSLAEQILSETELADLLAGGRVTTLTDRYAPVDQMLASVFLSP